MFNFIRRSIKRNFGIDKEYYRFIDDMFGFIPNNIELYKVALIHKSASQSVGGHHINNERLEYLGDAVIESITSDYLFIAYPDRDEGFLTQMRSKIVSRQSLNEMAVFIGLDKYLICKSGATLQQKHLYGDAFEAMMGAIYLDKGYEFTNRLLINDIFERFLSIDELSCSESDFKSRLIEWCQKNRHSLDFKTVKGVDKKSSAPMFYTTVFIDNIEMGHGVGDSKKSSEQSACCSVTREMSDEECAKLLDKYDRLMTQSSSSKGGQTEKKVEKKAENGAAPALTDEQPAAEVQPSEHKRRHNKKHKAAEAASDEQTQSEEVQEPVETAAEQPESAEEHPAKKRRTRRKKSDGATEGESADDGIQTEETEAQPAKRRRSGRVKAETPESDSPITASETASAEEQPGKRRGRRNNSATASENPSETTAAEEQQPAKRRRGRSRKSSETATDAATASESAAEPVSEGGEQ